MEEKRARPGDLILDRYMPDATPEQREEARANLKALVAVYVRIGARLAREGVENSTREDVPDAVDSKHGAIQPLL